MPTDLAHTSFSAPISRMVEASLTLVEGPYQKLKHERKRETYNDPVDHPSKRTTKKSEIKRSANTYLSEGKILA